VNASSELAAAVRQGDQPRDLETVFRAQYGRVARVIACVIRDPARAEELAVEVFLKWSRKSDEQAGAEGWLYRTAVRTGLNELRRESRRTRYERLVGIGTPPTPEEIRASSEEQERVRSVLAAMRPREAELLMLRSQGLSYEELAAALELNPTSIGTFLSRAQQAFRKEYVERYGE
jgi:RNA polymerase sigma-70 factor (ECF subfamily)